MSSQTTSLHLVKPAPNENMDIAVINGNMDIIDGAIGGKFHAYVDVDVSTATSFQDVADAIGNDPVKIGNCNIGNQDTGAIKALLPNPTGFANFTPVQIMKLGQNTMIAVARMHNVGAVAVCYIVKGYSSWGRTQWEIKQMA